MSLRETISRDVIAAMKAGEKERLSTLRMLMSAIKYKEVDLKRQANDEETLGVVSTLLKQRQDSVEQFRKGGREDLAAKEEAEAALLKTYLPPQLSTDELRAIVKKVAASVGAATIKDMGKLMKAVMPEVKGRADGKAVNEMVKEVLGG